MSKYAKVEFRNAGSQFASDFNQALVWSGVWQGTNGAMKHRQFNAYSGAATWLLEWTAGAAPQWEDIAGAVDLPPALEAKYDSFADMLAHHDVRISEYATSPSVRDLMR